ncbi:S8 family serine peptidase [Sphingomonas sp. SRS2]|uniref:S8 family serine peptidase n=1 Tax=Sphingomonas sp. SRS2 TaxID=133190 RepID=UPI000618460A|nr:S8 family serine peptidase [Sphingomonas sp. SRS2]KKC24633.1 hypothetical protein WP12_18180 [Sphingomonas sp. SRS2]
MRTNLALIALLLFPLLLSSTPGQATAPLVAVIDSGVARTAELRDLVVAEYDVAGPVARAPFRPRYDHGTMVATILAHELRRNVRIVSLRVDDPSGCPAGKNPPCQPSPHPIAAAIRQATALRVDAINISLALADDDEIVAAISAAAGNGIPVILAAGNDGHSAPGNLRMARAGYPTTVLVGALDSAGNPWPMTNRPDSQAGLHYHYVWRRGVDVPTSLANGGQVVGTGTSFAAPIETARLLQAGIARVTTAAR